MVNSHTHLLLEEALFMLIDPKHLINESINLYIPLVPE